MAHPFASHRQTRVEHARVREITKGYAAGGAVAAPSAPGSQPGTSAVGKRDGGKVEGRASGGRADRPARRARGGRTNAKKGSTVNILIGSQAPPVPPNGPAGVGAGVAPPMPAPRAPMPMPPPGMGAGPGGPPPSIRHDGGRAYASGGRIKSGPAWEEGLKAGTQVQHSGNKSDGKDIGRGKPITYASGGAIEAPIKGGMGPKFSGGSRGGMARMEKAARAASRS